MVARDLHHIVYPLKVLLFRGVSLEVHPGALTPSAKRPGACAALLLLAMLSTSPAFANPGANQRQAKDVSVLPAEAQTEISGVLGRERREYQSVTKPGGFSVENPRHGVSAEFTPEGVTIRAGDNHWGMSLRGYGYRGSLHTATATAPASQSNRVEYRRSGLTEWYENGPVGLEQGFTLARAPGKSRGQPLTFTFSLSGDLATSVDSDGRGLSLKKKNGTAVLRYSSLIATDARGRELHAWIELDDNQLSLLVNDASAVYPLTVDPLVQAAILTASDGVGNNVFGAAVGLSGDGNTIVVGQYDAKVGSNGQQGAAYVFAKPAGGWVTANEIAKLTASDGVSDAFFGASISVSSDGGVIVVGAQSPGQGAAYVFVKPASGWVTANEIAKLTASDGAAGDSLGYSVGVSSDGSTIVVGAPVAKVGSNASQGAAYVFVKPASGWTTALETAKLTASDGSTGDDFGYSVGVSSDGSTIVAGAVAAKIANGAQGAAYVFVRPGIGWSTTNEAAKLTSFDGTSVSLAAQAFGASVGVSGDGGTIAVGAPFTLIQTTIEEGSAYVFLKPASGWAAATQTAKLIVSDGQGTGEEFGISIAVSGDGSSIVVGTFGKKEVYVFGKPASGWATAFRESVKLTASGGAADLYFGYSVTLSSDGDTIVAGTPNSSNLGLGADQTLPGNAYVFTGSLSGSSQTSFLPASLDFGSQAVGTTSGPQTITLTNSGGAPLHVTSVAASANFISTNNCVSASPIAPGLGCSEDVTFAPGTGGPLTGALTFTDDSDGTAGAIQAVSLSGTGTTPPLASLSPASLTFGSQSVGRQSTIQQVMITNSGGSPLHVTAVVASANFIDLTSTNCVAASPLAPGGSCTEDVSFAPNSSGPLTGTLTFTDDSGGTAGATQSVSLSGTGVAVAMSSISPSSLNFGNQNVRTTSVPQTVTVTNFGSAPLHVSAVTAPPLPAANFASTQNCVAASPIAPGGSCSESVTFTPTSGGAQGGILTFTDDSGGTAGTIQSVSLSGTGVVPPHASLPVASLTFGSQSVGTQSTIQQVTITNSGGSALHVTAVVASANFTSTQNCAAASPIAVGGSCSENVAFAPGTSGPLTGTLTFTDDSGGAVGATQSVSLNGTGVAPQNASLSPTSLSFGNQTVSTTSTQRTVTLSNTGGALLHVTNVAVSSASASFTSTHNCENAPVVPGGSCSESVTFAPGSSGPLTGTLTLTDDSGGTVGATQSASLSGTGVTPPTASLSRTGLDFGNQAVGTTSNPQTVTLTNTGGSPLHVTAVAGTASFTSTHNCVSVSPLTAGASCSESVWFAPGSIAPFGGTLVFVDDSGGFVGASQLLPLTGTGVKATTSTSISAAPTSVFTGQPVTVTFSVAGQSGDTFTPTGVVSIVASTGENCSGPATSGSCLLTFLGAGARTISASYGGDANFLPSTSTSVQASVSVPTADLFVSQQPSLTSVKSATGIAYTLGLKNLGPNTAASVTMTDAVPANSTFVSISTGAPCTTPAVGSVGTITCTWGSLANGASATVTITVAVNGSGNKTSITNTVSASAATLDPNLANNTATVTTQITGNKK